MLPKAIQAILKAFLKNPNNIALRRKTFKDLGQEAWERGKFNKEQLKFIASEKKYNVEDLSKRTGMHKEGKLAYNKLDDKSSEYMTKAHIEKIRDKRLKWIEEHPGESNIEQFYNQFRTSLSETERNSFDKAVNLKVQAGLSKHPEYQQKGVLSIVRNILARRMWKNYMMNARRDQIAKLTQKPTLERYRGQVEEGGYFPQLEEVGEQISVMRKPGSAEREIAEEFSEKVGGDLGTALTKAGTWGHESGIQHGVENVKLANKLTDEIAENYKQTAIDLMKTPQLMKYRPEQGIVNVAKESLDDLSNYAIRENIATPEGLKEFGKLYSMAGVTSRYPGLQGQKMRLGKNLPFEESQSRQIDFMRESLKKDLKPFYFDLDKYLRAYSGIERKPTITGKTTRAMHKKRRELLMDVLKGNRTLGDLGFPGYAAGGLVGLGSRILKKLAKKLSRQEMKMMMGQ
tara:strand:+ start:897 stop:2270 length:1374 start_codon:yes stop_codon:yes gene_type:complete